MYTLVLNRRGHHTYSQEYAVGLFYFANRLEQFGLPFKFCYSSFDVEKNDTACFSNLLIDHTSIFNLDVPRIIVGGIGAHSDIITTAPDVLQISGASTNITKEHVENDVGKITTDPIPSAIEIPLIPRLLQDSIKIIQLNCGYGCFYRECLFCDRAAARVANPKMIALNICEIFKRYNHSVQLGLDGPNWEYLREIAEELIRLQPIYGKVRWACSIRATDASDYDNMKFLASSGLYSIGVGIEYLCDEVLQAIKKGITVDDIFSTFENSERLNLYLHFCIIDFDSFVAKPHRNIHHEYLQNILSHRYPKLSLSMSALLSNAKLDVALHKLKHRDT